MRRLKELHDRIARVEAKLGEDAAMEELCAKGELTADEIITLLCAMTRKYGLERLVSGSYRTAETMH